MQCRYIANQCLGVVPSTVNDHESFRPLIEWQVFQQLSAWSRVEQASTWPDCKPGGESRSVIDEQARIPQGFVHHPRRVERMEAFAPMLQDQDFRLIVDARNRRTITVAMRPEATETTVLMGFDHRRRRSSEFSHLLRIPEYSVAIRDAFGVRHDFRAKANGVMHDLAVLFIAIAYARRKRIRR